MSMRRCVVKCANTRNVQQKDEKKKLLRRWQQRTLRCLIVIESTNKKRNKNEKPVLFAYLPKQSQQVSDMRTCVSASVRCAWCVCDNTARLLTRHSSPSTSTCARLFDTHIRTHSFWLRFVISSAWFSHTNTQHTHGTHIDRLISCLSSSFFSA